jgi:PRTRC genetic system protein E
MFTELEPLLADRTLVLTISGIGKNLLRVNVIPKSRKENDAAEKAMTTPLSFTGTAAELDRELPAQLAGYTNSILETASTLQQVQEAHKAALQEIQAENKNAQDNKRKVAGGKTPAKAEEKSTRAAEEVKPASEGKPATVPIASLFDDPIVEAANQAASPEASTKESGSHDTSEGNAAADSQFLCRMSE